jgi:hypothetical protein
MDTKNKKSVAKTPSKKLSVELLNLIFRRSPEKPYNSKNLPCKCKSTDLNCTHFGA